MVSASAGAARTEEHGKPDDGGSRPPRTEGLVWPVRVVPPAPERDLLFEFGLPQVLARIALEHSLYVSMMTALVVRSRQPSRSACRCEEAVGSQPSFEGGEDPGAQSGPAPGRARTAWRPAAGHRPSSATVPA